LIIDAHTHLFPPGPRRNPAGVDDEEYAFRIMFGSGGSRMVDPETMLREMDDAGVDMAVLCPFPWNTLRYCAENNDYILETAASHPHRFLPFIITNPAAGKEGLREARRGLEAGARGIGELHAQPQGFDPLDLDLMAPLVRLAAEYGVPILLHVNEPVGHDYPGKGPVTPARIYPFIQAFPEVKLILPHWGGGLPFYELMPEVAEACSNVYYDSAASPFLYRSPVYALAAAAAGREKILFATDYPLLPYARTISDAKRGMEGDPALEKAVLGENAARLFGLHPG
jgi:hypothetical protein